MSESERTRYTAALVFCGGGVLLVQKVKPKWQRGLLNAIGGKAERGEGQAACVKREVEEETTIRVPAQQWRHLVTEYGRDYEVAFFSTHLSATPTIPFTNDVGEPVVWRNVRDLDYSTCVGNLRWILPLALDWRRIKPVEVDASLDDISRRPAW